jgi:hypothetical protein
MLVNIAVHHKPHPNALKHAQRLTKKECSLTVVVEHEGRDEARLGHDVPKHKQQHQNAELPKAQGRGAGFDEIPHRRVLCR